MHLRTFLLRATLRLAFTIPLAACSSTSSAPPGTVDALTSDGSASGDDAADDDAAATEDTQPIEDTLPAEGSVVTDTTTAACHSVTDISTGVIPVFQAGTPPTALGGTIPPGTYVLTAVTQYGGSSTTAKDFGTLKIGTSQIERAEAFIKTTQGFEYGGNQIFYHYLCAPGSAEGTNVDATFESTSNTFTEFLPFGGGTRKRTFTRQGAP